MTDKLSLATALGNRIQTREERHLLIPCVTIAIDGSVRVPTRPSLIHVQELERPESFRKVWCGQAIQEEGVPVLVEIDPKDAYKGRVIGIWTATIDDGENLSRFNLPEHRQNHQYLTESGKGPDAVLVGQPALQMLKTTGNGTDLTVSIQPYIYLYQGYRKDFQGLSLDLTSYLPSTSGRTKRILLYLRKAHNDIAISEGTEVTDSGAVPVPYPQLPSGQNVASAYVQLTNGQAAVTTATHIDDAREFITFGRGSQLPEPTGNGEILISSNGRFLVGEPLVDAWGDILTDASGEIVYA